MPIDFLASAKSPRDLWTQIRAACEQDDTALISQALAAQQRSNEYDTEYFYRMTCRAAIENRSVNVLKFMINHGADVRILSPTDVLPRYRERASKEILEILLVNGWDINSRHASAPNRGGDNEPFMWHVVNDSDMVSWCLAHGARVFPADQLPLREGMLTLAHVKCAPILEKVAYSGTIETFKLLQSKGAPLGRRTLHMAVEAALVFSPPYPANREHEREKTLQEKEKICPDIETAPSHDEKKVQQDAEDGRRKKEPILEHARSYEERFAMVRYLVDDLGLDVNAPDQPEGGRIPGLNGTPMGYVAGTYGLGNNIREVVWFLLDRGADAEVGVEEARGWQHESLEGEIEAWRSERGRHSQRQCSVQ